MKGVLIFTLVLLKYILFSQIPAINNSTEPGNIIWYHSVDAYYYDKDTFMPVLGQNGNIIWGYSNNVPSGTLVLCFSQDGDTLWSKSISGMSQMDPIVMPGLGRILLVTNNKKLYCLNPDGSERWVTSLTGDVTQSAAVDTAHSIYLAAGNEIIAIDSAGNQLWEYGSISGNIATPLSVSRNGVLYYGTDNNILTGLQTTGNLIFNSELFGFAKSAPSIDRNGDIYITTGNADSNLSCIQVFSTSGEMIRQIWASEPHLSGTIIGDSNYIYKRSLNFWGGGYGKLYKIDKSNEEYLWTYDYGPGIAGVWDLTLSQDGTVYLSLTKGSAGINGKFYAINADGTIKWALGTPNNAGIDLNPINHIIIGDSGILIAKAEYNSQGLYSEKNYLLAISEPTAELANTAWPMHKNNQHHSGLASDSIIDQPNIMLSNDLIDFGYVLPGDTTYELVTVHNIGQLPLTIDLSLDSDVFTIDTLTDATRSEMYEQTIQPEDSVQFRVQFFSNDTAMYWDTIFVSTNDLDQPLVKIVLVGKTSLEGEIYWELDLSSKLSSPALDNEGNIYITGTKVWSVSETGSVNWEKKPLEEYWENVSSITISHDNLNIYVPYVGYIIAMDSSGNNAWVFDPPTGVRMSDIAINRNGELYFSETFYQSGGSLYHIDPQGNEISNTDMGLHLRFNPVIDQNNNIISSGELGNQGSVFSLNETGELNWQYGFMPYNAPAIGDNNTVYFPGIWGALPNYTSKIRNYSEDGTLIWTHEFAIETDYVYTSIAIDLEGNLFFALGRYPDKGFFTSLDKNGNLRWSKVYEGHIRTTPAVGANGIVYFGCKDGNFYALNPDGSERWHLETGDEYFSSPAIDRNGIIYFGSGNKLYAVHGVNGGLAESAWPMIQHDPKHTSSKDYLAVSHPENKSSVTNSISLKAYPNPFTKKIQFEWYMENSSKIELDIFNIFSERVASFEIMATKGVNQFLWEGYITHSEILKPGFYFCRITVDGSHDMVKLIKK